MAFHTKSKEAAMADETPTPEGQEPATGSPSTQPDESQLGDAGKKALDEERKARRDAETRLKELEPFVKKAQDLEDAKKSETEKLTEKLTAAQKEAESASLAALRIEVALDKAPEGTAISLVRKLASRIQGSTRDELESDAEELFSDFTFETSTLGKKPQPRLKSGNNPDKDEVDDDPVLASLTALLGIEH